MLSQGVGGGLGKPYHNQILGRLLAKLLSWKEDYKNQRLGRLLEDKLARETPAFCTDWNDIEIRLGNPLRYARKRISTLAPLTLVIALISHGSAVRSSPS